MTDDREEFATQRRKRQDDFSDILRPLVKAAVLSGDWDPVLDKAAELYADLYTGEAIAAAGDPWDLNELLKALRENFRRANPDSDVEAIALMIGLAIMNAATLASMKGDRELVQEWVTMHDNKVRSAHAAADGQIRLVGQPFNIGGHPMPYPGWPLAPVALWINCRCVLRPVHADQAALTPNPDSLGQTVPEPAEQGVTMAEDQETEEVMEEPETIGEVVAVPWFGVLAPEGVPSGDKRMFTEGSLRHRDLPLPLTWQKVSADGHDQNVTVAKIEQIARVDGQMRGSGHFLFTGEADEVVGLIAEFGKFGVSIDADDATAEYGDDEVLAFSDARICSACIVSIPAFAEAYVALGEPPAGFLGEEEEVPPEGEEEFREVSEEERDKRADDGTAMPDGSYPIANCEDLANAIQAIGRANDPEATKRHIIKRYRALECPDIELPDTWASDLEEFDRGPGWVTHPKETRRIHAYWTKPGQPGYAKIGWGKGGDFNRCRALVGEKIAANSPEDMRFINQICAQWHHDALGIWPGEHLTMTDGIAAAAISLVAGGGWCAPSEWFEDPKLDKPTSMSFRTDERGTEVWGHLAEWETCHIGINGVCTVAPSSATDYAYFALGQVETDKGPVRVGNLTIGTGHAPHRLGAVPTIEHYDNTGTVWADVAIGEDEFGIWYHGWVRPGTSEETLYAAKASGKVSGDWREVVRDSGELELVAALSVNVEGFQKTKPSIGLVAGAQVSLVAAGVVEPERSKSATVKVNLAEEDIKQIAAALADETEARVKRRQRMAELREEFGKEKV